MSDTRWVQLGELTEPERSITYGVVKPGPEPLDGGVTLIRGGDISNGRVSNDLRKITEDVSRPYRRTLLRGGELIMSLVGNPGSVAIVPETLAGANLARQAALIALQPSVDARFVMYWFMSPQGRERLATVTKGSVQQVINLADLKRQAVPCPPLQTQRRIASILGAYDDLIEVNRRRIAVLEEMVRGLFEEWFVHFRFPGHNAVPILDTPDGPLPEGWRRDRIGDVATYVNRGIAPKYDDEAETLVIGQKCIRDQRLSLALARRQSKKAPVEKIVQPGDVLINSTGTGTLGRVAQAEKVPSELTVDSHVTIVRPSSPEDRDYLGLNLFAMQPVFEHLGAGSTNQTELARSAVQNQMLVWPPVDLRARFGRIVRPARELVEQLAQQNVSLAASRDLLLPRLISGQLSVPEAERQLEEAA